MRTTITRLTRRDLLAPLSAELGRLHSYEVPELLALPVLEGSDSYLAWLDVSLKNRGQV